ncbi:MAG: Asp23/Gls24 family envelope stress response protein [Clostridiales bacterium]|nr:MAG: Asp23/Gls24 family envelope stress response protein [Clostridiales bacterium]
MDISNELGTVEISEEVLSTIASVAANEVEGVAGLAASLGGNLKDLLTKKYAGKGISIEATEGGLVITASIIVKFKSNVQDVAVKVQDSILSAIHDMTNYEVSAVNVNVVNVQITDENK